MGLSSRPTKRRKVDTSDDDPDLYKEQVVCHEMVEKRLPFADADVMYCADFVQAEQASQWYEALLKLDTWHSPMLTMYGRTFPQSRQIAAYAHMPFDLQYSGTTIKMVTEYPPVLKEIERLVAARLGVSFNHCMLNRYDDGHVYIGKHRDNIENRVIASLSLGAERDFIMTHDTYKKGSEANAEKLLYKRWSLDNGSLLVMQGQTQRFWKHEIPKQLRIKQGRISLTFRQMKFDK